MGEQSCLWAEPHRFPHLTKYLCLGAWGVGGCTDRNRGVFWGVSQGFPQMLLFSWTLLPATLFSLRNPHSEDFSSCAVFDLASSPGMSSLGSRSLHRLFSECLRTGNCGYLCPSAPGSSQCDPMPTPRHTLYFSQGIYPP